MSVDICIIIPLLLVQLFFFLYLFFPINKKMRATFIIPAIKIFSSPILFMLSDGIERGEAKGNVQFHRLACLCISARFFFFFFFYTNPSSLNIKRKKKHPGTGASTKCWPSTSESSRRSARRLREEIKKEEKKGDKRRMASTDDQQGANRSHVSPSRKKRNDEGHRESS